MKTPKLRKALSEHVKGKEEEVKEKRHKDRASEG